MAIQCTLWISRLYYDCSSVMGRECSVYVFMYKIMVVGLVILTKVTFWSRNHILAFYCTFWTAIDAKISGAVSFLRCGLYQSRVALCKNTVEEWFCILSFSGWTPYQCRCKTCSIVISYWATFYHTDARLIVGTTYVYWSMFTSIYRLWITQKDYISSFSS